MAKKRVFISFDYEKDRRYKDMLNAWDANPNFEFCFSDYSSKEIKSDSISVVKAGLTRCINQATYTLVIIGEDANRLHKDHEEIGYRNWQNYEIAKSKLNGNKLVAVKINSAYESPEEILDAGASWAMSFTQENVINALNNA